MASWGFLSRNLWNNLPLVTTLEGYIEKLKANIIGVSVCSCNNKTIIIIISNNNSCSSSSDGGSSSSNRNETK